MTLPTPNPGKLARRVSWGLKLPNCGGVLCPPDWATPATIWELAGAAKQQGFDTVWLHDHLVTPAELRHLGSPAFHEPLITMAALATRTELDVGVATIVLPLRDPVMLAKQVATLAAFFPGRVLVGLGAGRYQSEFEALGVGGLYGDRGSVSTEYLKILRALLTQDPVTFQGDYRSLVDASMFPKASPTDGARILYAGNARVAARRAALLADGWIGAAMPAPEVRELVQYMLALRSEHQISDDFETAYSATIVREDAGHDGAAEAPSPALHQHRSALSGSAEQVKQSLKDYVDAGIHRFQLSLRAASLEELRDTMAWFASGVIADF